MTDQSTPERPELPDHTVIGGQKVREGELGNLESLDPGTGRMLASLPSCGAGDIERAVAAASAALKREWSSLLPRQRGRLLSTIGAAIMAEQESLAVVESLDTGKPLSDARRSVTRAADYFTYYAGTVDKPFGDAIPLGVGTVSFVERVPLGVTGHIVPWNVPISTVARSLAPALACGNTAVIKPAEDASLSAVLLADLLHRVGVPPGVVNVVTGFGPIAGQALAEHEGVHHLTFTGSVGTGKRVMAAAARHVASVTLELGGKSPQLVLAGADLDFAARDVTRNAFANAGQICSAGSRLLVENSIHDEFLERIAERTEANTVGYGLSDPDVGAIISWQQRERIAGFVNRARDRGLAVVCGGRNVAVPGFETGFYYAPTIVDGVDIDDELSQEEVFGPVLAITTIESLDEGIAIANGTRYGLAAGIHTKDLSSALRFAREVDAGQIYVNGYHSAGDTVPFGGMKQSGIGREKGVAALDTYSETKAITITI